MFLCITETSTVLLRIMARAFIYLKHLLLVQSSTKSEVNWCKSFLLTHRFQLICNGRDAGRSALPNMCAQCPRVNAYISGQCTTSSVATNMLHFKVAF